MAAATGNQQAGNLCHQRIANGQQDVAVCGLLGRQVVLQHTNGEAANDVDEQDQDARHGVAAVSYTHLTLPTTPYV